MQWFEFEDHFILKYSRAPKNRHFSEVMKKWILLESMHKWSKMVLSMWHFSVRNTTREDLQEGFIFMQSVVGNYSWMFIEFYTVAFDNVSNQ